MSGDFSSKLSALTSKSCAQHADDNDAMAGMIENLAGALAFTVAVACKGEADPINIMLEGITAHLYEVAAERAPIAAMVASARIVGGRP